MKRLKIRSGHWIRPSRPHSDKVRVNKKEMRREAKREARDRE